MLGHAQVVPWLGEPGCGDASLTGGKAANLSRLAAGYTVPPGFCLTAAHYQQVSTLCLSALDPDGPIPPALLALLAGPYTTLLERSGNTDRQVAVRSSAVDEDGAAASFAGQHETYLNLTGLEETARAVLRCWASAGARRALEYRRQRGLDSEDVALAVLIQQLIASDVSAVVFGANPITQCRDEVTINASWGIGESIVGGTVSPDLYRVHKDGLVILERQVAEKRVMTVAVPGGTKEVEVPRMLRNVPCLGDEQVREAARLAVALEADTGFSPDIECAWRGGRLYLLQCRPITTLDQPS